MQNNILENINYFNESSAERTFLFVQNTDKIPPHIGLVHDGKYYSVAVSGVKAGIDFGPVLKNIKIKNFPALLIELEPVKYSDDALSEVFSNYGELSNSGKSCLFPVIEVLSKAYQLMIQGEFLFEVVPELKKSGKLKNVFHVNMEHLLIERTFLLPVYTRNEIDRCIRELNEFEKI